MAVSIDDCSVLPAGMLLNIGTMSVSTPALGITFSQVTLCAWLRRQGTSGANSPIFVSTDNIVTNSGSWVIRQQTDDTLRFLAHQGTTTAIYRVSDHDFTGPVKQESFLAVTYDDTGTPRFRVYTATKASRHIRECSYAEATAGSGTHGSSAAGQFWIGNTGVNNTGVTDVMWVGIYNRVITNLDELDDIRRRPRLTRALQVLGLVPDTRSVCVDESGHGFHGTPNNSPAQARGADLRTIRGVSRKTPAASAATFRRSLTIRTGSRAA